MVEFMENGNGDYKTNIKKESIVLITENMCNLRFDNNIDFFIEDMEEPCVIIFYSKVCMESYKELLEKIGEY